MSVAHPATTPPLISKLRQKLDLDAPPDYGNYLDEAEAANRAYDRHVATYRDAIKAAWDYKPPLHGEPCWELRRHDYDEGFRRLSLAFPEIEEIQQLERTYTHLRDHMRHCWQTISAFQEADRKYRILVEATHAITHALNGYEPEDDQ